MIFNPATGIVIDSLGWVDKGALWAFDLASQTENWIASDLAGASIRPGGEGFFRVWHATDADNAVSIRHVSAPEIERAAVRFRGAKPEFSGDLGLWRFVETAVLMFAPPRHERLIKIDPIGQRVVELDLCWYLKGGYDLVYQGLIDCLPLPDENRVIVSVQRSSKLVVIDIEKNRPVGSIELANRGGNPVLSMRSADDFIASDYDTLCRVEIGSMSVVRSVRLQCGASDGTGQFIGNYQLRPDGTCLVARPFSGDVLMVDSGDFKVLARAEVGGQPLRVCAIPEDRVVTRDWKTGAPSVASLKPA